MDKSDTTKTSGRSGNGSPSGKGSRRTFIRNAAAASLVLASPDLIKLSVISNGKDKIPGEMPWYRRVTRWGQTNITEKDPPGYDIQWWRKHWQTTGIQGVIINAGGIVAYYPSKIPLHRQAQYLAGRDLFGELCNAAHEDGLAVFARMDSNRAHEEFYKAHPGWFAIDPEGKPYKAGELFVTCINSPYYNEHIPSILTEIFNLYQPEGFTDNSWSGLGRDSICYCENCRTSFHAKTGKELPAVKNWNDTSYRLWIKWNYERRVEIWDLNNLTTKKAGGTDCIWSGMNSGSVSGQARSFRDLKEICKRADILMLDSQARSDAGGFQQNADTGKLIHGLLGWDKLIPESMAMYQAGRPTFRLAAKPVAEARMWMTEGIAGGIQPWWHYVSASHEDRRIYKTAGSVFEWHKTNEEFLINRTPVATAGVIWSQQNTDFYGRDESEIMTDLPWRGVIQSLIRARIPYLPVNADHIDRDAGKLSLIILPNLGVMTDDQIAAVKRFVKGGGGLIATGESSLYNEWGDRRSDYALADIFGAHITSKTGSELRKQAAETYHTYLRLSPEMRSDYDGPKTNLKPHAGAARHPVLKGFDETDIISYGGSLNHLMPDAGTEVLMTFIPQFPIYPPETAWMREPVTDIPGLIINAIPGSGRIAFLPADIDRQFGRYNLPDHGSLLANIVRWAAKDDLPLEVECAGLIDCNLYRQKENLILHLVNLTSAGTWRQPVDEYIPVGPVNIRIRLPEEVQGKRLRFLVSGKEMVLSAEKGWAGFTINSITDHEVVVIN
ncbi:MAG TPA: Tat pathway signal protein [Bacteroidales bacterium]|nr:Tat pathway signal protein [Bacteroidales bacterium]HCU20891.1 Tat pathway signal protein [Bacteroidales bacterium]